MIVLKKNLVHSCVQREWGTINKPLFHNYSCLKVWPLQCVYCLASFEHCIIYDNLSDKNSENIRDLQHKRFNKKALLNLLLQIYNDILCKNMLIHAHEYGKWDNVKLHL